MEMAMGLSQSETPECDKAIYSLKVFDPCNLLPDWMPNLQARLSVCVRRPDKMTADTTTLRGKYIESLTFSTPNCIYTDYGKLG